MDSKATLSIPLSEYLEIQKKLGEREKKIEELEAAIKDEQMRDPSGRIEALLGALQAVVPVVQFAVASLPPESVRGWPYVALEKFGQCLTAIPGGDQHMIELGHDLVIFAHEVEPFEKARARGERAEARVGGPG
jgi:hypothetical protein